MFDHRVNTNFIYLYIYIYIYISHSTGYCSNFLDKNGGLTALEVSERDMSMIKRNV